MDTFWQRLPRPFLVQAPMDDVTDVVFRHILWKAGKPDVFFTEFTNTDGLCSVGYERVSRKLMYTPEQRPIVAQIWGTNPKHYFKVAKMLVKRGFDGIDINMGCPDKKIVARGSCGGLILNPSLAKEIILATKEGAGKLPVSVKTRIGYHTIITEQWVQFLLDLKPVALTLHGRTVKEMSKVPAHWEEIGKAVAIRNHLKSETLIIGNGDVQSRVDAERKVQQYGVDGVMIGRGIFHDLWIFSKTQQNHAVSQTEKFQLLIEHMELFKNTWGNTKSLDLLKKFYKVYVSGLPNAQELRMQLMEQATPDTTIAYVEKLIANKQPKH